MIKRLTIMLCIISLLPGLNLNAQPLLRPGLREILPVLRADTMVRINIVMKEQYPVADPESMINNIPDRSKRKYIIEELQNFSIENQKDLIRFLSVEKSRGSVSDIRTLWIANILNCCVKPSIIHELAQRSDIRSIDLDTEHLIIEPQPESSEKNTPSTQEITWNVDRVNAPQVWAQGFTGQNVVVSIIDSGVNYEHNDLGNMWEHPDYPFHGWNFVHNNNNPMDDHGHGTHVAGTVAGNGTSGSQTGIAPGAEIMALKALTATGSGTEFNIWGAIEFSVNHGAHIVNLSLGWTHLHNPDRASWRNVMNNALAAGVIAAVAAGNEGNQMFSFPVPTNVRTPADCPPPWLHPNQTLTGGTSAVVAVGATNMEDNVAGFSSLGPVSWGSIPGFNDYPYNPGMGLMRPDIVAPGVDIRSLAHFNNTDYVDGWQGTSMASPCVAGIMALLLSKNASLTPVQISQVIEETAVSPYPFKNNQYGSGLIDAFAAFNAIPFPGPSYHSHLYHDTAGAIIDSIHPGISAMLTLNLKNTDSVSIENVNVLVSSASPYVTITDSLEFFGTFQPAEVISKELAYSFDVSDTIPGGYMVRFEILAYNTDNNWISTFTDIAFGPNPVTGEMTINDSAGNNNGRLDPGETAIVEILNTNKGQWATSAALAMLSCSSPYLTLEVESYPMGVLNPGDTMYSQFTVHVDPETPDGIVLEFQHVLSAYPYLVESLHYQTVGLVIEDFETGDFSSFNWKHAGNKPWIVESDEALEGTYATRSGQISHSQSSQLFIEATVAGFDSISFYRKVSSEEYFDFLNFYINDYVVASWSGEKDWERVVFQIPPGPTSFKWEYRKDQTLSAGEDKAWIDYIVFPGMLKVNAGEDTEICPEDSHQLQGGAMNQNSVLWNSTGTGHFNDSTILDPVYYPGQEDIINGAVNLKLTAFGLNTSAHDEIVLNITRPAHAFAGSDTTSCNGMPVMLTQATAEYTDSVNWISSGSGLFDDPSLINTTYYPSDQDTAMNFIDLTMIAFGLNNCGTDTSSLTLYFIEPPVVFAGPDTVICDIFDYHAVHATAENYDEILWTSSGSGIFNSQTVVNPVYTPSIADIERGYANLTLHASGIDACNNASASLVLFFVTRAIAYAGPDLTVCIGDIVNITADSTAFSNKLFWSSTGSGVFNNDSIEHPVYYPSDEDYNKGVVQFILYAYGHSSCPPDIHSIFVYFIGAPAAPLMPFGPDSVDVYTEPLSLFAVPGVYLALDFNWQMLPREAGTVDGNMLEAIVEWNTDFNGIAEISVQAVNNCGDGGFSPAKTVQVYSSTGINEIINQTIKISPVPASDFIEINIPEDVHSKFQISIVDLLGNIHFAPQQHSDNQGTIVIRVSDLIPGVYLIRIQNNELLHYSKIIITR
jgi:subtilisin family serine protease